MPVQVFLNATLRKRIKEYDPASGLSVSLSEPATVAGLCGLLGIPKGEIKLVMINGRAASLDHVLKGDERIGLFPPVGGG
jgi:sulfur carrier protein ThiS